MNIGHAGLNVAPELKLMAALVNLDRAQLACPIVDVLKEVVMDCAKMLQIEFACRYSSPCPLGRKATLDPIQALSIDNPEPISEDIRAGIDVRIVRCRHFDAVRACSRM